MPVDRPGQYIAMQPRLRAPDERFRGQIQIAWSPPVNSYVLSVTVYSGEDDSELLSCVVAQPMDWVTLRTELHLAGFDLLNLVQRSTHPFDDLL